MKSPFCFMFQQQSKILESKKHGRKMWIIAQAAPPFSTSKLRTKSSNRAKLIVDTKQQCCWLQITANTITKPFNASTTANQKPTTTNNKNQQQTNKPQPKNNNKPTNHNQKQQQKQKQTFDFFVWMLPHSLPHVVTTHAWRSCREGHKECWDS